MFFYGEIWLIIPKLSLLPLLIWSTGVNPDNTSPLVCDCTACLDLSVPMPRFYSSLGKNETEEQCSMIILKGSFRLRLTGQNFNIILLIFHKLRYKFEIYHCS